MTISDPNADVLREEFTRLRAELGQGVPNRKSFVDDVRVRRNRLVARRRRRHAGAAAAVAALVCGVGFAAVVPDSADETIATDGRTQSTSETAGPVQREMTAMATYLPDGFAYQRTEESPDGSYTYVRYTAAALPGRPHIEVATFRGDAVLPPDGEPVRIGSVDGLLTNTLPDQPEAGLWVIAWPISEELTARVAARGATPREDVIAVAQGVELQPT